MDEYYCPNCGTTLNEQDGFDPSGGTWTCTSCGKLLMDDDVYEGDIYEGVAWYCDECGALLNRQSGFSDSYVLWTCTDCGYINGTTEDDIISENGDFSCPNCGSSLDNQGGFDKYSDDHECSSCGVKLHHSYSDDQYSVVEEVTEEGPECPNCGAKLVGQSGYSEYDDDWECTECGVKLNRSYSSEPYEVVEEVTEEEPECPNYGAKLEEQFDYSEYDDDWECTECGAKLHRDCSWGSYEEVDNTNDSEIKYQDYEFTENYSYKQSETCSQNLSSFNRVKTNSFNNINYVKEKRLQESELFKKRIKAFFFKRKKIQIKHGCLGLSGRNVEEVETLLYNQAFNNIKKVPIMDIYVDSPYKVGEVEQVVVGGDLYFCEGDLIPYDTEISIIYHVKREITMPFNEKQLKKMKYPVARDKLREMGFTRIYAFPIKDLLIGLIKRNGTIEKVKVGKICKFKKNSKFVYDEKIVIVYHTFKEKK